MNARQSGLNILVMVKEGKASSGKALKSTIQELFRLGTKLHPDPHEQRRDYKGHQISFS